jgi:hypothetical protein
MSPEQLATRMIPTARQVSSPSSFATPQPCSGMLVYWQKNPGAKIDGMFPVRRKSSIPSVRPIPSIEPASDPKIRGLTIPSIVRGQMTAITDSETTQTKQR